ncbi:hypothetical protein [Mucilaginibacter gossypii]|uniref:hypothetical protein n=1 Tax=Mucilaginibacter gossypii TaxID=551996 RepID=UPI000B804C0D|nr:hypothetical protein [Mucilaginibacter gossypii]
MNFLCKFLLLSLPLNYSYQQLCAKTEESLNSAVLKKDSVLQRGTEIIDGNKYTAVNIIDNWGVKFYIKDESGKIVYTYKDGGVVSFKFLDFNSDGYKDIVLELIAVDSGQQDLIIYDPKSKRFKLAGNCSNAREIPRTKYYYSYEDCCMGRNWSSNLFYIADSKIINIGHIKYRDGYGLSFFKLNGKKILLKKWNVRINGDTPVTTGPHIDFDLGRYWTKHWSSFTK